MNERIKEIMFQSGLGYMSSAHPILVEKFVELIVQECLRELQYTVLDTQELRRDRSTDYQVGWEDGMFDAGEMIKQHFGVEE
jgi:hypothetical protein